MPGIIPYQNAAKEIQYPQRVTNKIRAAFILGDTPNDAEGAWLGYFRYQDPTVLKENTLTFPSINCFIPYKDKIVPRLGSQLLGQPYTPTHNWPIVGNKKRFATMGGYEVEVRVTQTDDMNLLDVIEVFYPNPATGIAQWYPITQNPNPFPTGPHRYYFDDWFDTNLNPARSFNLSRLIWVNGLTNIFSWTGGIAPIVSIVPNTSISTTTGVTWASLGFPDASISGFNYIVINQTIYSITGGWNTDTLTLASTAGIAVKDVAFAPILSNSLPSTSEITFTPITGTFVLGETITGGTSGAIATVAEISGNSLVVSNVTGIFEVGETITGGTSTATATVITYNVSPIPVFDVCRQNKNYMYYGSWNSRKLYQSNGFSHDPTQEITNSQAVQNDLVVDQTHQYSGTGSHVYKITIDSINQQEFIPTGNGINDGTYDTAGYTQNGTENIYRVVVVADFTLVVPNGTYNVGDVVIGGTSLATARIAGTAINGSDIELGVVMISGSFVTGETITDRNNATSGTSIISFYQNWVQFYNNATLVAITSGPITATTVPIFTPGVLTLTDGLTIMFGNISGHAIGDVFQLTINRGSTVDTFSWQIDGGTPVASGVAITGANQLLNDNVTISFINTTGHTYGDSWEITVNQVVINAWVNFYYTLPVRAPGEGYIYRLPSNFWAMAPQEQEMYVNTKYGDWSLVTTTLASNLQSEAVSLQPLKQAASNKVIFPYMIGYLEDFIVFVTEDKKLAVLGRQKLLQLPQMEILSQAVQLDFDGATFEDGSMEYLEQRLYITSPHDYVMFVYDNHKENKYWQPPQVIPETGILSIVDNTLIAHSPIRNQTNQLFVSTIGDNLSNYTVRARSPYLSMGNRWGYKNSNMTFVEGYVTGAPPMAMKVYQDINGCGGIIPHPIVPVICLTPDHAPLGEGNFGSHQNGSDIFNTDSHFNEIYERYNPVLRYRFVALELECTTTNHSYSWLTFGINNVVSNTGNVSLKNQLEISRT